MKNLKKLVLSGMFLALGIVLPFVTGQIPQIGSMLCPMHIPVLLCGFICGWQYGLVVGVSLWTVVAVAGFKVFNSVVKDNFSFAAKNVNDFT